eukprot:gnl/Ergobibamus_cyprinoides/5264.p1 GENE.gnl/Ergobibamus_cyprinoides/5264~~gnl/Ergobibamus_cyprinoides/5264.p1  ORF type:complete len:134 (+),score=1.58 gnl/Ergobibamus_cyprinoides/5264:242-643(+)
MFGTFFRLSRPSSFRASLSGLPHDPPTRFFSQPAPGPVFNVTAAGRPPRHASEATLLAQRAEAISASRRHCSRVLDAATELVLTSAARETQSPLPHSARGCVLRHARQHFPAGDIVPATRDTSRRRVNVNNPK